MVGPVSFAICRWPVSAPPGRSRRGPGRRQRRRGDHERRTHLFRMMRPARATRTLSTWRWSLMAGWPVARRVRRDRVGWVSGPRSWRWNAARICPTRTAIGPPRCVLVGPSM